MDVLSSARSAALAFLSNEWAGLALAAGTGAAGAVAATSGGKLARAAGAAALLAGGGLAFGALRHLADIERDAVAHRPPGKLVEVEGRRIHVFAEGAGAGPSVVWFAGGHAPGFGFHFLHRRVRDSMRSILIDRPGTGWSDPGPYPLTTAREAELMLSALDRAGERGPYLFAGSSFGGLLCANMARRSPKQTAAVVLLDATPLDTLTYGPALKNLKEMQPDAFRGGLLALFGIYDDPLNRDTNLTEMLERLYESLGEAAPAVRSFSRRAAGHFASASIYRELAPGGLAYRAYDTVVYDGDLLDLPVFVVTPRDMREIEDEGEGSPTFYDDQPDKQRLARFYMANRRRYLASSTRAEAILSPDGSGHDFPYRYPDFTADLVKDIARRVGGASAG
jgi:pimeloyl-ACP methyl ester carboxylesterase